MNKSELIINLNKAHLDFWETAIYLPNPNVSINNKWSVSENVEHINISLLRLSNFLEVPKHAIEANFGLSKRKSKSSEEITKLFNHALANGAKTTEPFVPKLNLTTNVEVLISQGKDLLSVLISNLENWSELELEKYNCPHPLFGKITVREILYFTIYHVKHHQKTLIKKK